MEQGGKGFASLFAHAPLVTTFPDMYCLCLVLCSFKCPMSYNPADWYLKQISMAPGAEPEVGSQDGV